MPSCAKRLSPLLLFAVSGLAAAAPRPVDAGYDAACRFIEREEAWATDLARTLGTPARAKLGTDAATGASAYRHLAPGLVLDYVVTSDGRVFPAEVSLSGRQLDERALSARSVARDLLLPGALPDELKLGCDMAEMTIRARGGKLASLRIVLFID